MNEIRPSRRNRHGIVRRRKPIFEAAIGQATRSESRNLHAILGGGEHPATRRADIK